MTRTEIAGFRPKLYKTLQENATQKTLFQHKISGLGVVQCELSRSDWIWRRMYFRSMGPTVLAERSVPAGAERSKEGVADRALQGAACEASVGFHVTNLGFDAAEDLIETTVGDIDIL